MGSKTMSYNIKGLYTRFRGRFYGKFALGDEKVEEEYRKRKEKALMDSEKTSMTSSQVKYRNQRDLFVYLFRKETGMKYQEISNLLLDYDLEMSYAQISRICAKFDDNLKEKAENPKKEDETSLISRRLAV